MHLWTRIRFWLIRQLAWRDGVAINLVIGRDGNALSAAPGRGLLMAGCHIEGYPTAIHIAQ